MAVILTSTSDTPEQVTQAIESGGLKAQTITEGAAPEKKPDAAATAATETTTTETTKPAGDEAKPAADKGAAETTKEPGSEAAAGAAVESKDDEVDGGEQQAPKTVEQLARENKKLLKTIDKLTAVKYKSREQIEELTTAVEELKKGSAVAGSESSTKPAETTETELKAPTRPRAPKLSDEAIGYDEERFKTATDKYETDLDAYEKARDEYVVSKAVNENEAKRRETDQRTAAEAIQQDYSKRVTTAITEFYPDWAEQQEAVSEAGIDIPTYLGQAIVKSPVGEHITYYLATHLEEAERIAGLSPDRALVEIGKLEGDFSDGGRRKPKPRKAESKPADEATEVPPKSAAKPPETTTTVPGSETKPPKKEIKPTPTLGGDSQTSVKAMTSEEAAAAGDVNSYFRLRNAERIAKGLVP